MKRKIRSTIPFRVSPFLVPAIPSSSMEGVGAEGVLAVRGDGIRTSERGELRAAVVWLVCYKRRRQGEPAGFASTVVRQLSAKVKGRTSIPAANQTDFVFQVLRLVGAD